ncbi:hypothetical protein FRB99_005630 [Tulasnella sp. 403]|nr:hypothetical protein FRB99_005630 [Tulasnella sp. 403]
MRNSVSIWTWIPSEEEEANHCVLEALYIVEDNFARDAQNAWITVLPPANSDSIDDLENLDDFCSTNFAQCVLSGKPGKRNHSRSKKSKKFNVLSYIPEPHYLPYPDHPGKPRNRLKDVRNHAIKYRLQPNVDDMLSNRYARYSWLIPINGKPPCSHPLTRAMVIPPPNGNIDSPENSQTTDPAAKTHGSSQIVAWTVQDLLIFWLWLKDTQHQSIFGSVSLSLTSVRVPVEEEERDSPVHIDAKRKSTQKMHYITLYHDATYSLRLRTYIGHFNPVKMTPTLSTESQSILMRQSIRGTVRPRFVLKGAKLLLTDEEGRGILNQPSPTGVMRKE